MRHGESIAQGFPKGERWRVDNDILRDAPLAPSGEDQARKLRGLLVERGGPHVELVVCSPLTRALQTAIIAFGDAGVPILPHPGIRENGARGCGAPGSRQQPECTGRCLADLRSDMRLQSRSVDWSATFAIESSSAAWWSETIETQECLDGRLNDFCDWLARRPEVSFAVVCHFNVITRLLRTRRMQVENCRPYYCTVSGREWSLLDDEQHGPCDLVQQLRPPHIAQTLHANRWIGGQRPEGEIPLLYYIAQAKLSSRAFC